MKVFMTHCSYPFDVLIAVTLFYTCFNQLNFVLYTCREPCVVQSLALWCFQIVFIDVLFVL